MYKRQIRVLSKATAGNFLAGNEYAASLPVPDLARAVVISELSYCSQGNRTLLPWESCCLSKSTDPLSRPTRSTTSRIITDYCLFVYIFGGVLPSAIRPLSKATVGNFLAGNEYSASLPVPDHARAVVLSELSCCSQGNRTLLPWESCFVTKSTDSLS